MSETRDSEPLGAPYPRDLPPADHPRAADFAPDQSAGLFVGVGAFRRSGLTALPCAVDDAVDLAHAFFTQHLVRPGRVRLALEGEPTKPESRERLAALLEAGASRVRPDYMSLIDLFAWLSKAAGEAGLLLLSAATHGFHSASAGGVLAASDTRPNALVDTGIRFKRMFEEAQKARARRRLYLLDACRAECFERPRGTSPDPLCNDLREAICSVEKQAEGQAVMLATMQGGHTYEDARLGNGVFSAGLLQGLQGNAGGDRQGFVTAPTLAAFAQNYINEWAEASCRVPPGIDISITGSMLTMPLAPSHVVPAPPPPPRVSASELERAYLLRTRERHRELLRVFPGEPPRSLEDVYVAVRVAGSAGTGDLVQTGGSQRYELEEVLQAEHERLWLLIGNPGAGKTTLLRRIASTHSDTALAALEAGERSTSLPVFVYLARWASSNGSLLDYVEASLVPFGVPEGLADHLGRAAETGRLLLLLDGIDELEPGEVAVIAQRIAWLATEWPRARIVVSSRPYGFVSPSEAFGELTLLPLDANGRHELASRWLDPPALTDLLCRIEEDLALREMAEVPLLLTMMCLVERDGRQRERPGSLRTRLFGDVVNLLLSGRPLGREFQGRKLNAQGMTTRVLQRLALALLRRGGNSWDLAMLEELLIEDERTLTFLRRVWNGQVGAFLREVEDVSGLLFATNARRRFRWRHRSLQEFLAARALNEQGAAWRELARRIASEEGRWAEVFSFLAGLLDSEPALQLLCELARLRPAIGLRALMTCDHLTDDEQVEVLAAGRPVWRSGDAAQGREIAERAEYFAELPERLGEPGRTVHFLERLIPGAPPVDLAFIWLCLEGLRDESPRANELLVREEFFRLAERPLQELNVSWIDLSPGTCYLGSTSDEFERQDQEGPRHPVFFDACALLAVPVTNALYERFDPAHRDHRAFAGELGSEELDRHPVVNVCWYEAFAFALWAGGRLPSEAEWEYACRAGTTSPFSFGPTIDPTQVNYNGEYPYRGAEQGLYRRRTSAAGSLPANPWGLHDMHGNVWEWCRDRWSNDYVGAPADGSAWLAGAPGSRVVRGGCYSVDAKFCRSAFRSRRLASERHRSLGFRLARSAPQQQQE